MTSPAIRLSNAQEERLRSVDVEVDDAMRELERWLRSGSPGRPAAASMNDDDRVAFEITRARLRELNEQREALRAKLVAERTEEIRREHLATMIADQETRRAVARAATDRRSSEGRGLLGRLFGKR